jgi:hypothetical protein
MAATPFTYDPAQPSGKVRLLAVDADPLYAVFTDQEISAFLEVSGNVPLLAAAQALDVRASRAAIVQGVTSFGGVSVNGQAVESALHAQAVELRRQYFDGDDGSAQVDWAEMVVDDFSYRQRLINAMLRMSS